MIKLLFKSMVLISCLSSLYSCKKGSEVDLYAFEKKWIHENGGIYKNETLILRTENGIEKPAKLNWSNVNKYIIDQIYYTEVQFTYSGNDHQFESMGLEDKNVTFSLVFRERAGKTEAAIKFTQRNAKIKNEKGEKWGIIESYNKLNGTNINMWFTENNKGKIMKLSKHSLTANIKSNSTFISSTSGQSDCNFYTADTYEYRCRISGGPYNDTECGWEKVSSESFIVCSEDGGGSGENWPPYEGGGGSNPQQPPKKTPCAGDIVKNPTIAPSNKTNIQGGRWGLTRRNEYGKPKPHWGLDIYAIPNTPIYAAYSGTVTRVVANLPTTYKAEKSFGNFVEITFNLSDGSTIVMLYGHLNSVDAALLGSNPHIEAGQLIGLSGRTGNAQDVPFPHVHIGMTKDGIKVNPEPYIATKFDSAGKPIGNPC